MRNLVQTLKLGGSTAAMVAATIFFGNTAQAQGQDAAPPVEQVVVSASRINIAGYTAPTPVTVVDPATIASNAYVDIGTDLRQLPSVGQSWSPDTDSKSGEGSQGDADLSTVDLRDLGNIRTLVLFDGQRVVMSNPNSGTPPLSIGGVDLQTLPQVVIQRAEVVTGGASAAWGSDAVAGVVNLIIDKNFTGIKGDITFGDSYKDDHRQYKAQLFIGSDFLGDRAHVEVAGNWVDSPDLVSAYNRGWYYSMAQIVPSASLAAVGMNESGSTHLDPSLWRELTIRQPAADRWRPYHRQSRWHGRGNRQCPEGHSVRRPERQCGTVQLRRRQRQHVLLLLRQPRQQLWWCSEPPGSALSQSRAVQL